MKTVRTCSREAGEAKKYIGTERVVYIIFLALDQHNWHVYSAIIPSTCLLSLMETTFVGQQSIYKIVSTLTFVPASQLKNRYMNGIYEAGFKIKVVEQSCETSWKGNSDMNCPAYSTGGKMVLRQYRCYLYGQGKLFAKYRVCIGISKFSLSNNS